MRDEKDPIQSIHEVDVLDVHRDGTVELGLLVSGPLLCRKDHYELLVQKLKTYLKFINGDEFRREMGDPNVAAIKIIVIFQHAPDVQVFAWLENLKDWTKEHQTDLSWVEKY